jgi:hypothetical protein
MPSARPRPQQSLWPEGPPLRTLSPRPFLPERRGEGFFWGMFFQFFPISPVFWALAISLPPSGVRRQLGLQRRPALPLRWIAGRQAPGCRRAAPLWRFMVHGSWLLPPLFSASFLEQGAPPSVLPASSPHPGATPTKSVKGRPPLPGLPPNGPSSPPSPAHGRGGPGLQSHLDIPHPVHTGALRASPEASSPFQAPPPLSRRLRPPRPPSMPFPWPKRPCRAPAAGRAPTSPSRILDSRSRPVLNECSLADGPGQSFKAS